MILRKMLTVHESETSFTKRGFNLYSAGRASHLETIGRFFLKGYHLALDIADAGQLCPEINNNVGAYHRGFSYEGAAMALLVQDGLSLFKKDRLKKLIESTYGDKHTYMLHVGAGWGYARLPVSIEKKMTRFDPLLRWLVMDGYGFHQAYFKTNKYVRQMQLPKGFKNSYSIKAFYQGVGRCLWFVECAAPEKIAERISLFSKELHADLWSGAGLACAYACDAGEEDITALKKLAGTYFPHFAQGAVFAAKARERAEIITEENEVTCKIICSMSVRDAASVADECLAKIPEGLQSAEQYEWWRQSIRNVFIKTRQYEPAV